MTRLLLGLGALALVATACESEPIGPQCEPVSLSVASTRGDTVVLNTGLRYLELSPGTGSTAEYCDAVQVRYTGRLSDGTEFDAGVLPPFSLGYGAVIPGFEQGIIGVEVGGRRRLIIPPQLGYGNSPPAGSGIPAGATLIFDVELLARAPAED